MALLTLLDYWELVSAPSEPLEVDAEATCRVLDYQRQVAGEMQLPEREFTGKDLVAVERHGEPCLFHLRVYPRRLPQTRLIVVADSDARSVRGHLLIDLAADSATPQLDCPSADFLGTPSAEEIGGLIRAIEPDDENPFAVLTRRKGTYLQTYCDGKQYQLEHQLVNISSHYETTRRVSVDEVIAAMTSYVLGTQDWLRMFRWRRQRLDS